MCSESDMFEVRGWGECACALLKWNGVFRQSGDISDFSLQKKCINAHRPIFTSAYSGFTIS